MARMVDLNCDMGESFGVYKLGFDEEVIKYINSANIACGFHAGDPHVMRETVRMAKKYNVAIGAHPSYPDLIGFGRRNIQATADEVKDYMVYQIGALRGFARTEDLELQHVKPHGSLYNMAVNDETLANSIVDSILEIDKNLILVALPGSKMEIAARQKGLKFACEVFADRAYNKDGTLVSRKIPGSVIHNIDEISRRVSQMVTEGTVVAITGEIISIKANTICVHGDTPGAVEIIGAIKERFAKDGIETVPMGKLL